MAEKLPTPKNRNICRLSLRYGQYHMSVPYDEKLTPQRENQARVVALDPGVRSFLTWYSADSVGKIGEGLVLQDAEALRETGRSAEPCCEVTGKKATQHATCGQPNAASHREPGCGVAQAGSALSGEQLRCHTAAQLRDV